MTNGLPVRRLTTDLQNLILLLALSVSGTALAAEPPRFFKLPKGWPFSAPRTAADGKPALEPESIVPAVSGVPASDTPVADASDADTPVTDAKVTSPSVETAAPVTPTTDAVKVYKSHRNSTDAFVASQFSTLEDLRTALEASRGKYARWVRIKRNATNKFNAQETFTAGQAFSLGMDDSGDEPNLIVTLFDGGQIYQILRAPLAGLIGDQKDQAFFLSFSTIGRENNLEFGFGNPRAPLQIRILQSYDVGNFRLEGDGLSALFSVTGDFVKAADLAKLDPLRDAELKSFLEDRVPLSGMKDLAAFRHLQARPKLPWLDQIPKELVEEEQASVREDEISHLKATLQSLAGTYVSDDGDMPTSNHSYTFRLVDERGETYFAVEQLIGMTSRLFYKAPLSRLRPYGIANNEGDYNLELTRGERQEIFGKLGAAHHLDLMVESPEALRLTYILQGEILLCDRLLRAP